jgi:hypothetical protein
VYLWPSQVVVAALLLAVASAHESSLRHTHDVDEPLNTASCDDNGIATCNANYMACLNQFGDRCDCRGAYIVCLQNLKCPDDMVASVMQACIESGCTKLQV